MVEASEALTRKVADLARLELSDAEVRTFTSQLGEILAYVDQLSEVPVEGVAPMTRPHELAPPQREDLAVPFAKDEKGRSKVLGSAPEAVPDGFKVPAVL